MGDHRGTPGAVRSCKKKKKKKKKSVRPWSQSSRFESSFQREESLVKLVFKEEKTKLPNKEKNVPKSLWSSGLSVRPWSQSSRFESCFQREESLVKPVFEE